MHTTGTSNDEWLKTEYTALAQYFVNVITFRFTTAAFFIAAVALVLQIQEPKTAHYILLFALSFGIWVVELRNRAVFDNLLHRAWEIEKRWRNTEERELPLFTHMTPGAATRAGHSIPKDLQTTDQTRMLWFGHFPARVVSHTLGLDILYLSVMVFALWSLASPVLSLRSSVMDPVLAVFTLAVMALGYKAVRAADIAKGLPGWIQLITGVALIIGAAILVSLKAL